MRVSIRFRGPIAGKMREPVFQIVAEDGAPLGMVLQILIEQEESVREVWDDRERIDREALILRNEVDVGLTGGLETILEDGDNLAILPLVHGG